MTPTLETFGRAIIEATIAWRQHARRLRELRASKRRCEFDEHEPCWLATHTFDDLGPVTRLDADEACEACRYNEAHAVPDIKAERARRKGLVRKLARAGDRLLAQVDDTECWTIGGPND